MWLAREGGLREAYRLCMRRKSQWFLSALLFVFLVPRMEAQEFHLHVTLPDNLKGTVTLTLYDHAEPRNMKVQGSHSCDINGSVKGPAYAELRHSSIAQPLSFFIENNRINITFNYKDPNASAVTGSRTNSLLRYQLEECADNPTECLSRYVAEHPDNILSPYILDQRLASLLDYEALDTLYKQLSGAATQTYHYRQLGKRLASLSKLAIGAPLPYFLFFDDHTKLTAIDTVMRDSCYHLLMVGATWCEQCSRIANELVNKHPEIEPFIINIDRQKMQWESNLVEILAVDHIPYLLLLDPQKRIVARDFRIWELDRILKHRESGSTDTHTTQNPK